ncbi:MAG: AAA family ATPase [Candidatus Dormibacteria bacterium]
MDQNASQGTGSPAPLEPVFISDPEDSDYIAVAASISGVNDHEEPISGVPLFVWGGPGSGKSSLTRATLRSMGMKVVTMVLGVHEPSDLIGTPRVGDKPYTEFKPHPKIWEAYNNGEPGYALLLDDVTHASPALQVAAMRLVLERESGELNLRHVPIVLTGNDGHQGALWELNAAFANRMIHIVAARDNATRFQRGHNLQPRVSPQQIQSRWDACYAIARSLTNGFKDKFPDLADQDPPEEFDGAKTYSYPTGRSWDMATRAVAGAMAAGIPERRLVEGAVGGGIANEYATYALDFKNVPSPADVYNNLVDWKRLISDRPDTAVVAASSAGWAARTEQQIQKIVSAAMVARQEAKTPDIFIPTLRLLRDRNQNSADSLFQKIGGQVNDEINDALDALGA